MEHVDVLRELREPYVCMADTHKGESSGEDFQRFVDAIDAAIAAMSAKPERRAPVQGYHGNTIPWEVHGLAWEAYAKEYGRKQSAERIAERGGFGTCEMDTLLPDWRKRVADLDTHPQGAVVDGAVLPAKLATDLIVSRDDRGLIQSVSRKGINGKFEAVAVNPEYVTDRRVVDGAMVERALKGQHLDGSVYDWLLWSDFHESDIHGLVRAALVAALGEGE